MPAHSITCTAVLAREALDAIQSLEAERVHRPHRRRGGITSAPRGVCASATTGREQSQQSSLPYFASGVGLAASGSITNVLAVIQVIEKLPIEATSATRLSSPIVFSAVA